MKFAILIGLLVFMIGLTTGSNISPRHPVGYGEHCELPDHPCTAQPNLVCTSAAICDCAPGYVYNINTSRCEQR